MDRCGEFGGGVHLRRNDLRNQVPARLRERGLVGENLRRGDCYHRLGNQILRQRLDGERKPILSSRVARERIGFFMAAEGDRKNLLHELEVFYRGLPPSGALGDAQRMEKGN